MLLKSKANVFQFSLSFLTSASASESDDEVSDASARLHHQVFQFKVAYPLVKCRLRGITATLSLVLNEKKRSENSTFSSEMQILRNVSLSNTIQSDIGFQIINTPTLAVPKKIHSFCNAISLMDRIVHRTYLSVPSHHIEIYACPIPRDSHYNINMEYNSSKIIEFMKV